MIGYHIAKRMLDIIAALLALVVLSPIFIVVAVLVVALLGSPIFFTQQRVTKGEKVFRLWKFRTMLNTDPARGLVTDAQRMTRFGRLLRSSSLDELPSLWNILHGEMSFIGPRPLPTHYLPHYSPQQRRRHLVRAGLSGSAQVSGRNHVHWDDRFDLDVDYVDTVSLALDLRIIIRTIGIVLRADGISQDGEATADNFGGTLKSDLLVFDDEVRSERTRSWSVRSTAGHEVGHCDISAAGDDTVVIRFDAHPEAENDEKVRREVIRLVTNRARATEATFAVWVLPTGSEDLAILTEAGFDDCDEPADLSRFGHRPGPDQTVAVCTLWPESAS
ncbi:sugar transferase [Brevibacterium permense]|uniref:sugar transferase n=1 Tax=Brevibacterium permense TaxID=234834 RepID=UPI0021D36D97|nr:sugar transferase [Brevibacterium permense]MCU4295655.1 sugar transferase [Brevibacterium permense]